MSAVSSYKLSQLDGMVNDQLTGLQNSVIYRHVLKPQADLMTFVSTKYKNWNITKGVTIYLNTKPVITEETKFSMIPAKEDFTVFNADGEMEKLALYLNADGQIKFEKPLKSSDIVEADFTFRFKNKADIHRGLYRGLLTVGRMVYQTLDPALIPPALVGMVVDATMFHFYEEMSSESSQYYDYAIEEQKHSKHQVAANLEALKTKIDERLMKAAKTALWQLGNGKARQVVSIKNRWVPSSSLQGENNNSSSIGLPSDRSGGN